MKTRFSKDAMRKEVAARYESAKWGYENAAKKKYDPTNGTNQIPVGNVDAFYYYGKMMLCDSLLDDVLAIR